MRRYLLLFADKLGRTVGGRLIYIRKRLHLAAPPDT